MLQQLSVVAMLSLWARKALGIGCQKRAWLKASNLVFLRSQASHLWHVTYQQYFIKSCHKLVTSFILPDAPKRFSTAAWKPVTLSRKKVWQVLSVLFVRQPHVFIDFSAHLFFSPLSSAQVCFLMCFHGENSDSRHVRKCIEWWSKTKTWWIRRFSSSSSTSSSMPFPFAFCWCFSRINTMVHKTWWVFKQTLI